MALVLYLIVVTGVIVLASRRGVEISRAAAIALVLLPMVFTGHALLTNRVYAPIDLPFQYEPLYSIAKEHGADEMHDVALSDLHCQIIPWQKAVRYALANGDWPLWNPFILCGDILAAAAQPAVYDPINWIGFLLPLPHALTFGASMTFFLAGFFTFLFARASGRSEVASLFAAAAFMFGGQFAFYVAWPLARAWAFLPFVLLGVRRVVYEQRMGALLCAFVLVIVAGHPESVLHIVAVGAVYGAFIVRTNPRAIPRAAIAGVVALLLTAIYLLPFAEAASQTSEHDLRTKLYAPTPYGKLINEERREHRIGRTFLPYYDGLPWRGGTKSPQWDPLSARAGNLTLALALAALFVAPRRAETWFFFVLGAVCMNIGFGAPPFAHWLHEVPLFDIAINERLAFAAVFAMAMLAAIAIDAAKRLTGIVVMLAAIAVCITAAMVPLTDWPVLLAEVVPLAIAAVLIFTRANFAAPMLLALLLIQRVIVDGNIYPALPASMFYPETPLLKQLPKDSRVAGIGYTFIPNHSAMYELEDARGYEAMTFKRLTDTYPLWSRPQTAWFNVIEDPSRPFLNFLNITHFIQNKEIVKKNERALPRAFVPPTIRYERSSEAVLNAMKSASDFAIIAWIESDQEPHDAHNGPGRVTIKRDGLAFDIDATMDGAGWIVISETAWKGWRAYIDGKRARVHFANHAFLGVHVPAGTHKIRLVYLPESFTRGRAISIITLVALIAFAALRHRFQQPRSVRV